MRKILFSLFALLPGTALFSQAISYIDPAQAFNRLLIEKGANSYTLVGNFKVVGSPYLFGEHHRGTVYTKEGVQNQTLMAYNTHNQSVSFYNDQYVMAFTKPFEIVDSFHMKTSVNGEHMNLIFINGIYAGSPEKIFLQVVNRGPKFDLFKAYKSPLGYVSTNYVQPELREFALSYDFYLYDHASQQLKKLKLSAFAIKKQLKPIRDVSTEFTPEEFNLNPEQTLKRVFNLLNY